MIGRRSRAERPEIPIVLALSADWVIWRAGLETDDVADIVSGLPAGNTAGITEAVRALDAEVLALEGGNAGALWIPEGRDRAVLGTMTQQSLTSDGGRGATARAVMKQWQRPPQLPGVTVLDYSISTARNDVGEVVVQHMATHTGDDEPVLHTWRGTVFPDGGSNVVVLQFQTSFLTMLDEFDDALVEVLADMRVAEEA